MSKERRDFQQPFMSLPIDLIEEATLIMRLNAILRYLSEHKGYKGHSVAFNKSTKELSETLELLEKFKQARGILGNDI